MNANFLGNCEECEKDLYHYNLDSELDMQLGNIHTNLKICIFCGKKFCVSCIQEHERECVEKMLSSVIKEEMDTSSISSF